MVEDKGNGTTSLREDVREIKDGLNELNKAFNTFLITNTKEISSLSNIAMSANQKACKNEEEIKKLVDQVSPILVWMKIIAAIGSVILVYLVTQVITKLFP